MATAAIAADEVASHATLAAATVDTVTFTGRDLDEVEVINRDGLAPIHFTVDGSTPTVGGAKTFVLPGVGSLVVPVPTSGATAVKLISAGMPAYSVTLPGSRRSPSHADGSVPVGARQVRIAPSVTISTSAFAVDDALTPLFEIANAVRSVGKGGRIVKTMLFDKLPGTGVQFEVFFFSASDVTAAASNDEMAYSDANMLKCLGSILLTGSTTIGKSGSVTGRLWQSTLVLPFTAAADQTSIWAQVILRAGTPTYGASDIVPWFMIEQD